MNKAFEKILEKLQEQAKMYHESIERQHSIDYRWIEEEGLQATEEAIDIINQVESEYNNGWIPCSERLPEEYGDYLVWWTDITRSQYYEIVEYEPSNGWIGDIPQAVEGKYSVIAWQPLPHPPKGE